MASYYRFLIMHPLKEKCSGKFVRLGKNDYFCNAKF